jgi:hypothetical protein
VTSNDFPAPPPPSVSGILDAGFRLYRRTLRPNLGLSLLLVIASQAPNMYRWFHAAADVLWWLLVIAAAVLSELLWAALLLRLAAAAGGKDIRLAAAVGYAVRCLPGLITLTLMSVATIALGLVMVIVPGLLATLVALLAPFALLLENRAPFDSLRRAWLLVRTRLGLSAAVVALTVSIFLVFYIVFAVAGILIAQGLSVDSAMQRRYSAVAGCVAQALFAPLIAAALRSLYDLLLSTAVQDV